MAETMRPFQALAQDFERDGFVTVPDLITRDEARALKQEIRHILDEVIREARETDGAIPQSVQGGVYVGLSKRSAVCRQFAGDPRLLDVIEALIGPNILFWSDKVVFKSEEAEFGTPWHQDWPYWKGIHKLTLWLALDDIDERNGCLQFIPGSHRETYAHHGGSGAGALFSQRLDAAELAVSRAITVPAPSGTAVVFHDLTLHASHPNRARSDRFALAITYKDAMAEDLDYPEMTAAAVVRGHGRA